MAKNERGGQIDNGLDREGGSEGAKPVTPTVGDKPENAWG